MKFSGHNLVTMEYLAETQFMKELFPLFFEYFRILH